MKPYRLCFGPSRAVLLGLVLVASGCAKAKITPITASTRPTTPFQRVMVLFPVSDVRDREGTESLFAETDPDPVFIASSALFDFGRRYTAREVSGRLAQHNVDAVLLFFSPQEMYFDGRPRDANELVSFLSNKPVNVVVSELLGDPGITAHPTTGVPRQAPCGDCTSGPGLPAPGATSPDPWARSAVALRAVRSGRVAWSAVARASDMFWRDPSRYFRSIVKQTIAQLQQDGMIPCSR